MWCRGTRAAAGCGLVLAVVATGCGNARLCKDGGGARANVSVEWGVPVEPCMAEICEVERDAACSVDAIEGDGPITLTLACDHAELGPATDILTIDLEPGGAIDLAVGAEVSLAYTSFSGFEYGGAATLRLTDDAGLVLAHTAGGISGGFTGDPDWGEEKAAEAVAPLTAAVANAGCRDEAARNFVTVGRGGAEVEVPSGGSDVLEADASWLVVVETSERAPGEADDERIDLAAMRLRP